MSEDPWGPETPRPDPRKQISHGGPSGSTTSTAFKFSFFPTLTMAVISLFGFTSTGLYGFWFIGAVTCAGAVVIGLIIAIVAAIQNSKMDVGAMFAGIMAGVAAGIAVLFVTCFINLASGALLY